MRKYTFSHNGIDFVRINKTQARNAYLAGKTVYIVPCNIRPFSTWRYEYPLNRKNRENFCIDEIGVKNDFNSYVNSFEFYNCINSETGKFSAFYMEA